MENIEEQEVERETGEEPGGEDPGGEEMFHLKAVVDAFVRLAIACKSRSLYPADHPAAKDSATLLHAVLSDSLATVPEIRVRVGKDSLMYHEWSMDRKKESLRQLASRIRALNIQELTFRPGTTSKEVEALVELLATDPEEVDYEGGAETVLFVKGARNISIMESMAQRTDEEIEDGDLAALSREEGEEEQPEIEPEELPEKVRDLLEMIRDPEKLAGLLLRLAEQEEATLAMEEHLDAIYQFLKNLSVLIERNYSSQRDVYYRSMAESLLYLETGLRNMLLIRQILPKIAEEPLSVDILSQFTPQEIVDLLGYFYSLAPELVPKTRNLLKVIGFQDKELETAIKAMRNKLLDLGEVDPSLIDQLDPDVKEKGAKGEERMLPTLKDISDFFGEYRQEEIEEIRRISDFDLAEEGLSATTPMLLDLLERGSDLDNLGKALELMIQHFWDHIEAGQIGYAAAILDRTQSLLASQDPGLEPFREQLVRMMQEGTGNKTVHRIILQSYELRDYPQAIGDFERYMSALGDNGVKAMVEVLGDEEEMSIRKYICDSLEELGQNRIRLLGSYIQDERWYLVRNIVSIIGRFHTSETIHYLSVTLSHPNSRVRAETIRALGMDGSYEARGLLLKGLESQDDETRILCIRWLGRLKESRAIGVMSKMLEGKLAGAEDMQMKKEIVLSLGCMDSPDVYHILRKYSHHRKLLNRAEWEEINIAARKALDDLLCRYPHLEGRR